MPKHTAPEHSIGDVLAAMPSNGTSRIRWRMAIYPHNDGMGAAVAVECGLVQNDGSFLVYRRWGERVGRGRSSLLTGALYRAAMKAYMELGEVKDTELEALASWSLDKPR